MATSAPNPASLARAAVRRQNPRQEPGALNAHAGICAGGGPSPKAKARPYRDRECQDPEATRRKRPTAVPSRGSGRVRVSGRTRRRCASSPNHPCDMSRTTRCASHEPSLVRTPLLARATAARCCFSIIPALLPGRAHASAIPPSSSERSCSGDPSECANRLLRQPILDQSDRIRHCALWREKSADRRYGERHLNCVPRAVVENSARDESYDGCQGQQHSGAAEAREKSTKE